MYVATELNAHHDLTHHRTFSLRDRQVLFELICSCLSLFTPYQSASVYDQLITSSIPLSLSIPHCTSPCFLHAQRRTPFIPVEQLNRSRSRWFKLPSPASFLFFVQRASSVQRTTCATTRRRGQKGRVEFDHNTHESLEPSLPGYPYQALQTCLYPVNPRILTSSILLVLDETT